MNPIIIEVLEIAKCAVENAQDAVSIEPKLRNLWHDLDGIRSKLIAAQEEEREREVHP